MSRSPASTRLVLLLPHERSAPERHSPERRREMVNARRPRAIFFPALAPERQPPQGEGVLITLLHPWATGAPPTDLAGPSIVQVDRGRSACLR